ncbi:MAG: UDP-N-acetylmuramoyl-L-alanyl-D-glutamate--2,6-diaminopimelate ligase [Ruminococcus sp.]|nr:UDP-N-acetylmuramoyl-L-alanyl-D-glutamate--2,6-diaminopimelate ligase [Candidatus Copronaster equi]
MKLSALLQDVETNSFYTANQEIINITDKIENVMRSGMFVCIKGNNSDGHGFVHKALDKGAAAIICEKELGCDNCIVVDDTRKAYAKICANFYGNRHRDMTMIGITGTNGKTTTSFVLKKILEDSGYKVGLIGTVSVMIGDEIYPASLTTPDPAELHRYIMMMYIAHCDVCIMEVSSQALSQQRVLGIDFRIGIFTNLSPEHLDYHKSLENYADAKAILMQNSEVCLINADDDYSDFMSGKAKKHIVTYGVDNGNIRAEKIRLSSEGVSYTLKIKDNDYNVIFDSMGIFSVYNSMAALSAAKLMGVNMDRAMRSVSRFDGIAGRMESIKNNRGVNVVVDYAHTPASLESALKALKQACTGRLITVFGCGGDRDSSKRPVMGKTACKYSDEVYVTSDNPRNENPEKIISEIVSDITGNKPICIPERTMAIKAALENAKSGDTVLIAGKGHEKYQIIGNEKIYYNEREFVKTILERGC